MSTFNSPWIVTGDFSVVASQEEKLGGGPINLEDVAKFLEMMQQANLTDVGFYGNKYTWTNNRIGGFCHC